VNKSGGLAATFPGGRTEHARRLVEEGIELRNELVAQMDTVLWWPPDSLIQK
jgi:hypothetical protein